LTDENGVENLFLALPAVVGGIISSSPMELDLKESRSST